MPTREKPKYKVGQRVAREFVGVIVEVDPDLDEMMNEEMYHVYFPDIGESGWYAAGLLEPKEDDDAD